MKRFPVLLALLGGAVLVGRSLRPEGQRPLIDLAALRRRMMERMMESMPEDSPPRLVMSILPRLQEQNDQILALLKEQNELLRRVSAKR